MLIPAGKNWLDSGAMRARIYQERGLAPHKLRDLHFDVLIPLTARARRSPPHCNQTE